MRKLVVARMMLTLSCGVNADEQKTVDMSDPTAVYSSLGISVDTREYIDV